MGIVFGKIPAPTPKHEVIHSTNDYEIRKYPPSVVAEVTYDPAQFNSDKDGGFTILGNYIGALGKPQNQTPEPIAMTAPVITKAAAAEKIAMTAPVITKAAAAEKIAMTAPVVTQGGGGELVIMTFILPSKYVKAEEAPRPVDERVVIREEGEKKYGVVRFSGVAGEEVVTKKAENLKGCLERDGFKVAGDFVLARYNPPFTLPPFRTNEVMIPVE
ncbi:hypothetical protein BUALT_Bualt09G0120800 [Buddleja alternifolia]|uniref:SOUL heme-binding protein n=1 Tax=Buddleja alternifolia TaxID=168488 RepID=A0AAV6X998_9LAMI|nr:hypothetical protein BUALT_Bualt09G0120800 [Buddleja alternifolia]